MSARPLAVLALALFLSGPVKAQTQTPTQTQPADPVAVALERSIAGPEGLAADSSAEPPAALSKSLLQVVRDPAQGKALAEFYAARGYAPVWFDRAGLSAVGVATEAGLEAAAKEGLTPEDYMTPAMHDAIGRAEESAQPDAIATAELRLAATFLRYATDLQSGRQAPIDVDPELFVFRRAVDLGEVLRGIAGATDPARYLERLAPDNPEYRGLRSALERYRELADGPTWPTVADGPSIKPGMTDARLPAIRRRLAQSGSEAVFGSPTQADLYDPALVAAVEGFQRRFGLETDGIVGKATVEALNIPAEQLVRKLVLNMERRRWMPDDLGRRHVAVNIAGFDLRAVEEGQVVLHMPVIVGKLYRRSPIFSDRIRYLEVNPYWTVPNRILVEDLVPKIRKNPRFLEEQGFSVFRGWDPNAAPLDPALIDWTKVTKKSVPYRVRQAPGPKNALGQIKFMFPNHHNVYLHDTPSRELFKKAVRDFSSGCIRVAEPMALAAWLMRDDPKWSDDALQGAVDSERNQRINLPEAVPVHLTYVTAWLDENHNVHFRNDIYGRDRILAAAIYSE